MSLASKPDKQQETFVAFVDVLERSAALCRAVERTLRERADEADVRYRMLLDTVADAEARLADGFARHAQTGSEALLCTRLQYQREIDLDASAPSVGAALNQVEGVNARLQQAFEDYAESMSGTAVAEQLNALALDVEGTRKQIAEIRQSGHDY